MRTGTKLASSLLQALQQDTYSMHKSLYSMRILIHQPCMDGLITAARTWSVSKANISANIHTQTATFNFLLIVSQAMKCLFGVNLYLAWCLLHAELYAKWDKMQINMTSENIPLSSRHLHPFSFHPIWTFLGATNSRIVNGDFARRWHASVYLCTPRHFDLKIARSRLKVFQTKHLCL